MPQALGETIARICPYCVDGQMETVNEAPEGGLIQVPCPYCDATGLVPWATFPNPYVRTFNIIDNTDSTEYNALSDANKDAYKMIVSSGVVDLSDGTSIRTKLWNMFDDQSTTRANIITLLGE